MVKENAYRKHYRGVSCRCLCATQEWYLFHNLRIGGVVAVVEIWKRMRWRMGKLLRRERWLLRELERRRRVLCAEWTLLSSFVVFGGWWKREGK